MNRQGMKPLPLIGNRSASIGVCLALVLMVWFVFGQTLTFDFINCDDNVFVYENPIVLNGVTWDGVVRTLTRIDDTFYYPLTVLSFMVESELYGMNPAGFHFTNVVLHSLSVVLLFLLLRRITGTLWGSAFLAAIFAIHPIQVEAVAWVTGRKDVLSGVFFLLTVHAYLRYADRPFSFWRYGLVFVLFAAGLMAKPMLVTLPCVLLLLDYWPLHRLRGAGQHTQKERVSPESSITKSFPLLLLEKTPFFLLSAVFCVIPFFAGSRLSGGSPVQQPEWSWRIGNTFISYATYLRQMVWPVGLAMPYPKTPHADLWVIASVLLLIVITMGVIWAAVIKKSKAITVGWLWFVGMLLPVSGAVRFLGVARADRFVYLPMIGILILIGGVFKTKRLRRSVALLFLLFLAALSFVQTGYWRNNITLWTRSLESTGGSAMAYINLGAVLYGEGELAAAEVCFFQALEVDPQDQQALYNLGIVLLNQSKVEEGLARFREVLVLNPDRFDANKALGGILLLQGNLEEGIEYTRRAFCVRPEDAETQRNLEEGQRLLQERISKGAEDL